MESQKPKGHIFLIGFMGAGKSTVALELCGRLHMELMEMDAEIVRREGMEISEIFEKNGENYFRDVESSLIGDMQNLEAKIVSCGGGVVLRPQNVEKMKQAGMVIFLNAKAETIYARVKDSNDRPILNGNMNVDYIRSLMEKRSSLYMQAADRVIDTDGKSVREICDEIIGLLL